MNIRYQKTLIILSCTAIAFCQFSCTNNQNDGVYQVTTTEANADSNIEVVENHNDAKFDNDKEDDAKFMVDAAEGNMLQIELGKLAQKNAMAKDVKNLGSVLEKAHTKAQEELQVLANKKQVSLPGMLSSDGQDCKNKMSKETGSGFEKEYCDKIVKHHQESIERFEKAAGEASDSDVKAWATSMLPELRSHLDLALTCQKKLDKKS